jgi:hypothetical protein
MDKNTTSLKSVPQLRRYPELDGRTFVLGVGGTKCATSWVYFHLRSLAGVAVSPLKEVNFFNAVLNARDAEEKTEFAIRRLAFHMAQDGTAADNLRTRPAFQASVDRMAMIYDPDAYFGHFTRLCRPDTTTLCDITPAYAPLGRAGFEYVRHFCASQDVTLKVFYIMRDPVDRLWSHLRFLQQNDEALDVLSSWRRMIEEPMVAERADYRQVIEGLNAVLPPENILYLFYEDLFSGGAVEALSTFIGARHTPPDTTRVDNETRVKIALPDAVREDLRRLLNPQYEYCREVFSDRLPSSWLA